MDDSRIINSVRMPGFLIAAPVGPFRASLSALAAASDYHLAGEVDSFQDMLAHLQRDRVDLVLLDAGLHQLNGPPGLRELSMIAPDTKVIVIAEGDARADLCDWLGAGARGYVARTATLTQMRIAVGTVLAGGVYAPISLCEHLKALQPAVADQQGVVRFSGLTERQRQIMTLVMEGWDTNAIARHLDIARATVRIHLLAIYRSSVGQTRSRPVVPSAPERTGSFAVC